MLERTKSLVTFPDSGRVVPELGRRDIREIIVSPYRVMYRRTDDLVEIAAVRQEAREFDELHTLRDDEAVLLEGGADPEELPDWPGGGPPKTRDILESPEWIALPSSFDIHEWAIMEDFARSVAEPDLRDELLGAIRGRRAFRRFKDAIYRNGIQEAWYHIRRSRRSRRSPPISRTSAASPTRGMRTHHWPGARRER